MSRNFIGGNWRDALSGATLASVDPGTGAAPTDRLLTAGPKTSISRSVRLGRRSTKGVGAHDSGRAWPAAVAPRRPDPGTRGRARRARVARHRQTAERRGANVVALARYFEFYGGAADKWHGETIPYLNGYLVALLREPHGVTGHILPWNYPGADVRPHAGAVARGRQRSRAEAGRGRLRLVAASGGARRRSGLPRRRDQHRHRPRTRCRRRARRAPAASTSSPSPARPPSASRSRSSRPITSSRARSSSAASRRRSCSRTPTSTPPCRSSAAQSSRTPGRRARPAAACWSSAAPTSRSSSSSARLSRSCARAARR